MLKKGLAFVPVCFGVSFTKTSMNQASAIIHVYFDGSICVHTAAVEMGQGVSTKITQLVQDIFGLKKDQIRIDQTNTSKIANTSPTAASTGTDLNGKATEIACLKLKKCLAEFALEILNLKTEDISKLTFVNNEIKIDGQKSGLSWNSLVSKAYENRISLTSHAHYSTPHINFDPNTFLGQPYSYHVYGVSLTEVTVDTLRGRFEIDGVYIIHDFGQSINPLVDGGQLEGALMQGIGWLTVEDLLYNQEGKPLTDTLSAYKIPDIKSAPKKVDFRFLKNSVNSHGVRGSKGVGEPPLIYGIGTFLAIREAMKEFRQNSFPEFIAPMTPERILSFLYLGPMS